MCTDDGFCDYEVENNAHGVYMWRETQVGDTDNQICVFGTKEGFDGRMATRYCAMDGWMVYNSAACTSRASYELMQLQMVGVHKSCIIYILYIIIYQKVR